MPEAPIPFELVEGLNRYVTERIETGSFLRAVLENNLVEAMGRADDRNIHLLPAIVAYVRRYLPFDCWGSAEKVADWLRGESHV